MFKHILVPIYLTDRNERTLRIAAGLARIKRSRVTLLHVIHALPQNVYGPRLDAGLR
jgi:nucleotide-binding universal stress UspA family protein